MSLNEKIKKTERNAKILLETLAALCVFSTAGLIYESVRGKIDGSEILKKTATVLAIPYSIFLPTSIVEHYLERKQRYQRKSYQEQSRAIA